jgi:NHLM bacteriocin system ABC transporter peptidase/ATP-binding protein
MMAHLQQLLGRRRGRTPTVLQMEAVECGAASLAMILGYYGRIVPLEELRGACGVSRDGTKASNLLKAARKYGLSAKGFSKQPDELESLPLPAVVFWNFNHFVVLEGFGRGCVYLNDPAVGPRRVTRDEFAQSFTGVVLVFQPAADFQPGGQRRSLLRALRSRLRGSEAALLYVLLASLAVALTGLIIPLFSRVFVDYILVQQLTGWILPLLLGMAGVAVLHSAVTWLQRASLLRLSTHLAVTSSYAFLTHLLRLPVEFFSQRYAGEVGARVEINDRLARLLSGELAVNMLNVVTVVVYLGLMLRFNVPLTLVALTIAASNIIALRYVARKRIDLNARLLQERGKLMGTSMAGLQTIESLKATGGEADFFSRWAGYMAKVMVASQEMSISSLALSAVPTVLAGLGTVVILGCGAQYVMHKEMTIGTLVAFQALMAGFLGPVQQLVALGGSLQEVEGGMNRLDDVLSYAPDPNVVRPQPAEAFPPRRPRLSGRLELRKITYGYSRLDPPLISGFSLSLKPGARVALVGPSASGKSTVSKIISGIYAAWSGEVLLDGEPREQIPRNVLSNSLAMVDQDFFLYEGTVREVLSMWDTTIPEECLVQAAKDACIHDDIAARAGGYDSLVEEGGRNFSSGQRQRLEIARALVGNPSLLVLDEATSALDPVVEKEIDENLRRRGCACVIVAHRLSTIRDCDEILVLDRGAIVQRGTHETLERTPGLYRQLIRSEGA